MKKTIIGILSLALVLGLTAPVSAHETKAKAKRPFLKEVVSSEKANADALGIFKRHESSRRLYHVAGTVTAVSDTSISVSVKQKKDECKDQAASTCPTTESVVSVVYTFKVDNQTKVLRRYKGKATISEVAVNDKVKVWVTKLSAGTSPANAGTARLIWDKSIWWVGVPGVISELNTAAKTLKLVVTRKGIEYTTTVKADDLTKVTQAGAAKSFTDLANGQQVSVRGSWSTVGKYILARTIKVKPAQ